MAELPHSDQRPNTSTTTPDTFGDPNSIRKREDEETLFSSVDHASPPQPRFVAASTPISPNLLGISDFKDVSPIHTVPSPETIPTSAHSEKSPAFVLAEKGSRSTTTLLPSLANHLARAPRPRRLPPSALNPLVLTRQEPLCRPI